MWGRSSSARTISRATMGRDSEAFGARGNGIYATSAVFGPATTVFLVTPDQRENYISRATMIDFGLGPYLDTMESNASIDIGGMHRPATRFPLPWLITGGACLYAVEMHHIHGIDVQSSLGTDFLDHFNWRRDQAQITLTR